MRYNSLIIQTILFVILTIGITSCEDLMINSLWRNNEIIIDGSNQDWKGKLKYFEDEKVAIGIANDNDFIYFCLTTSDNAKIMKILQAGFTVWFEHEKKDNNTFGIQYPIKKDVQNWRERPSPEMLRNNNIRDHFSKIIKKIKTNQYEILIVNEENDPINIYPLKNKQGLEVEVDYEMGQLIYELKIPLNNKHSEIFAVASEEKILNIGFESGKIERPKGVGRPANTGQGRPSGAMRGGGKPGGSGGRPGGGGRPKRSKIQEMVKQIDFNFQVELATLSNK